MAEQGNVQNRILCVDDDEKTRILLRKILETEGFVVSEASNGQDALERVSHDRPDVIIMDIQMPGMDGFETLSRLRSNPDLCDIPALALTARGMGGERERIVKAGYLGYLPKPIQRLHLIEELDRLLLSGQHLAGSEAEKEPLGADEALQGKSVLLVDDNIIQLQMGEKILSNSGMRVLKAVDGKDALNVLGSGEKIDLILTDILMPRMDGYQLCRMLKTTGEFLQIPLVFYTSTYADNSDVRFGLDLGADRFIVRPITPHRLLEIIKEVLREYEQNGKEISTLTQDTSLMVDEVKYYQQYNERLVNKLEQKLLEIDSAYRTLEMRNQELQAFNTNLEDRVHERTKKLKAANHQLMEQDKKKSDFLNIVAHDLRTPITTIRSYAELLLKYTDEPERTREEFLHIIINESIRLGNLINDYLDLIKIESGTYRFRREAVDLSNHIDHAVNVFRRRSDAKGIVIKANLDPRISRVLGDPDKLDQVLVNLLSNAVKFCHSGGKIEIHSYPVRPGEKPPLPCTHQHYAEKDSVAIMIRDTGPGIPEIYQESIFERFTQVDSETANAAGGTGLGLSIVKWIIDQHQGKIWVESREGEGSAFYLLLPAMEESVTQ